jgi:hypothetical protein
MMKARRGCRDIELFSSLLDNVFMGRPKNFSREEVLDKAMPVFWKHGFGRVWESEEGCATLLHKKSSNRDSRGCTHSLTRNHFSLEDIGTEQSILKRVFRIFFVSHNREDSLLHCCSMPSAKFDEGLLIAVLTLHRLR